MQQDRPVLELIDEWGHGGNSLRIVANVTDHPNGATRDRVNGAAGKRL